MRLKVGERWIGAGERCYVIAEAGSNHNGNLETALALIDVAAEAGADAVKFQGFRARTLYPKSAGISDYLGDPRTIYDIIEAMELAPAWLPTLAAHCAKRGVHFLCTPFDEEWVELLDPHVPAFKLASYEMSHLPLARAVLGKKKPVFASTGAHTLQPVEQELRQFARRSVFAVKAIRAGEAFSADNVGVLRNGVHAPGLPPSAYPRLLGRRAKRDITAEAPITAAMVEDGAE